MDYKISNLYEKNLQECLLMRPGGLLLTQKILEELNLEKNSKLLDIGCGKGISASYISKNYEIDVYGIDCSEKLIMEAKNNYESSKLIVADALNLPFEDESFQAVIMECSLSTFENINLALTQAKRVLRPNGVIGISDIYFKSDEIYLKQQKNLCDDFSCGIMSERKLKSIMELNGFRVIKWQDESKLLKEFLIELIWKGSEFNFDWFTKASKINTQDAKKDLSYFTMIAQKNS